jgi:outer membrane receptor protein involved in Fe transport
VGIYELNGFSARLAYNWRSSFVDSYNNGGGNFEPPTVRVKPMGELDFSGYYTVSENLTVTLDAANLLNYKYQDYFGNSYVFPRDTRQYDRTVILGVRFRL